MNRKRFTSMLMEGVARNVATFKKPGDDSAPIAFVLNAQGKLTVTRPLSAFLESPETKDILGYIVLPELVKKCRGVRFGMVISAWYVEKPDHLEGKEARVYMAEVAALARESRLSEHPDRLDIAEIAIIERGFKAIYTATMKRHKNGQVTLGKWNVAEGNLVGRMIVPVHNAIRRVWAEDSRPAWQVEQNPYPRSEHAG